MLRSGLVIIAVLCGLCATNVVGGRISARIVGGKDAVDINFPWIVSLFHYGTHICGGSIINKRTILTAAHCLTQTEVTILKVRVGSKYKSSGGKLIAVETYKFHENYNAFNMDYDIGVMRLDQDLEYSDSIQPIALPRHGEDVSAGTDAIVSGWGYFSIFGPKAEYLQYAVVPIINQVTCNRLFKNGITDRMLCAGVLAGGIDACTLDSGGPLVVDSKLVGVVSWGHGCALPDRPGVYTRVSELVPWVADYLNQFNETLQ